MHIHLTLCLALSAFSLTAQSPDPALTLRPDASEHYARVEAELRAAPQPANPAVRARRGAIIEGLRAYRLQGTYGINERYWGLRQPHFVDDGGRRCAVAFLLDRTGHGDVTEAVARASNYAWVADLAEEPGFLHWLDRYGLTLAEAARIQAPGVTSSLLSDLPPPAPPSYSRPVDSIGGATTPRPAGGRTSARGAARTAAVTPRRSNAGGMQLAVSDSGSWTPWFDLQASRWFGPRPLPVVTSIGTRSDELPSQARARCLAATKDGHIQVRAAAAQALGRLGVTGDDLRSLLEDQSYEVKLAAVAGFAHAGTAAAVHTLLGLATKPNQLQPFALAAIGASGRRDASAERIVSELLENSRIPSVMVGAAAHDRLLGGAAKPATVSRTRAGKTTTIRGLAAAAVDGDARNTTIAALTQALSSAGHPARRSAAAALARTHADLALPALMTAYELERDIDTRSQLLLAIGEHGGDAARPFLIEQMSKGKKMLRGWAAAGLGIWGRAHGDQKLAALVRKGYKGERNSDRRGLWLISLGLLRDDGSSSLLVETYEKSRNSTLRAAAVYALGLLGNDSVGEVYETALREDDCPFVRTAAATVCAALLGAKATPILASAIKTERDTTLRGVMAFSFGATGDPAAAKHLFTLSQDKSATVRAAAIRGLGRLLAVQRDRSFAKLAWGSMPIDLPPTFRYLARLDR